MHNKVLLFFFTVAGMVLLSCNNRPDFVLSEKETIDLLTDIQVAEAYLNSGSANANKINRDSLMDAILAKHGVDRIQLDSTVAYYGRNMDEYYAIYEKVEKRIREKGAGVGSEKTDDVKNNLWPYTSFATIFRNQNVDGLSFSFQPEDISPGSSVEWAMRLSSTDGIELLLGVGYQDGTSSYIKRTASGSRSLNLKLQTDTAKTVSRLFGRLNIPSERMPVWIDSIRLSKFDFDSMEYVQIRSQRNIYPPSPQPLMTPEKKDSLQESN